MNDPHKTRNAITEHKGNYKLYNPYLVDAYASLPLASLTKISMVLFNSILSNKLYHREDSTSFSESEDKRIYNTVILTPEHLLMQCNPTKYMIDGKDMQLDVGNFVKKLNELDDMNIFYLWKMGHPNLYMFFIERDIGVWKCLNPKAVVTPKTLYKILRWGNIIVETMKKMLEQEKQFFDKKEVEKSFGLFINKMISKMSSDTSMNFEKWSGGDMTEYLRTTLEKVKALAPYDGLVVDDEFLKRLPISIRNKLMPKTKEKDMSLFDVEEAIIPKEANVTSVKTSRKKKLMKTSHVVGVGAEIISFSNEVNPMKNCNEFIHFYRDSIRDKRPNAKFSDIGLDRKEATEILDMMIENRKESKHFLSGWISYYVDTYLPSHLPVDYHKTALSSFRKTFAEFSGRYVPLV